MLRPIRAALCGVFSGALLAAALSSQAAPPAERELMGVRIWRDYAAVLQRHGEPTRVVPGIALPPEPGVGSINVNMQGARAGGGMSMPGNPRMGNSMSMIGPPGAPMMGSMPMMGAAGGAAGGRSMPMMGGAMAGGSRFSGQRSREEDEDDIGSSTPVAGMSGAPSGGVSRPGGPPGMPGMMGGMGGLTAPSYGGGSNMMSGLMMGPGMMGGMGGATAPMGSSMAMGGMGPNITAQSQAPASVPSEEVKETWVYEKGDHTFQFLFNRDGRVIRIQSFGKKGAGATSRAISLGDPLSKVYSKYGWAGSTTKQGDSLTLDYSQKAHVVFDLVNRRDGKGLRVVGITIAPSEGR